LFIIQGPISVAPCQTLISRFATFASLQVAARWSVAFDGLDDALLLPAINDVLALSFWVKLHMDCGANCTTNSTHSFTLVGSPLPEYRVSSRCESPFSSRPSRGMAHSGAKVANRDVRDSGWEGGRSRGRFATPADSPRHDGTPYRAPGTGLRVRLSGLGFVHRSRAILSRLAKPPSHDSQLFASLYGATDAAHGASGGLQR
jgi:hypothetical protein